MTTKRTDGSVLGKQASSLWIDESGAKKSGDTCFVVAGIKTRHPDQLLREIQSVRDQHSYRHEMKFGRLNDRTYDLFVELVDTLERSDAHLAATVVDRGANPFRGGVPVWKTHARLIAQLVIGNTNRNEQIAVLMDGISTPPRCSLGHEVKRRVNARFGSKSVTLAVSLDSKTNDLLQLADLVAGAIRYERLNGNGSVSTNRSKQRVARRLAAAFDLPDFSDRRMGRVNIATWHGRQSARRRGPLRVVGEDFPAS